MEKAKEERGAKTCPVCGGKFVTGDRRRKYCSPECRVKAANARQREYNREHKDRISLYQRKYRESHREERKAYSREYYRKNKDKINAYQREYRRRRGIGAAETKIGDLAFGFGEKPENCGFKGPCLECPYPECVED